MASTTHFPTDASIRTVLALRCNSVVKHCTGLLASPHIRADICVVNDVIADIARVNDIMVNFMGFGSITENDLEWLSDACERMELYTSEEQYQDTEAKFAQIIEGNSF